MKLLLHTCCGPCTVGAMNGLRDEFRSGEVRACFYNPNIHPQEEWTRRREAMVQAAAALELPVIWAGETEGLVEYLKQVVPASAPRCRTCYIMRLAHAAQTAAQENCDAFTTTLTISPYQDLEEIRRVGEAVSKQHGPDFIFRDLRPYYAISRERSKALGLYRQKYCGCIFSALERKGRK